MEHNEYGYIGEPKRCGCGGVYVYYEGVLGYESLVCNKFNHDIQDN